MVAVNELTGMNSDSREAVETIAKLISPFAPHIAEEMWHGLGHESSVTDAEWPEWDESCLTEATKKYPVSFNGKVRYTIEAPADADKGAIEKLALENAAAAKWLAGKEPRKIIVVPGKIVNVVV